MRRFRSVNGCGWYQISSNLGWRGRHRVNKDKGASFVLKLSRCTEYRTAYLDHRYPNKSPLLGIFTTQSPLDLNILQILTP